MRIDADFRGARQRPLLAGRRDRMERNFVHRFDKVVRIGYMSGVSTTCTRNSFFRLQRAIWGCRCGLSMAWARSDRFMIAGVSSHFTGFPALFDVDWSILTKAGLAG